MSSSLHCLTHHWSDHSPNDANTVLLLAFYTIRKICQKKIALIYPLNPDHTFKTMLWADMLLILFSPLLTTIFISWHLCDVNTSATNMEIYLLCLLHHLAPSYSRCVCIALQFRGVWEQIQARLKARLSSLLNKLLCLLTMAAACECM